MAMAAVAAIVALPSLYLAKRLHRAGFEPEHDREPDPLDLHVSSISENTVSLRRAAGTSNPRHDEPGHFLLNGTRGLGYVGPVTATNGVTVVREFRPGRGELRVGDAVRLDSFAFPDDPLAAHGIDFENVTFASPLGEFPAWHIPGRRDTWAILTHGKGATRRETLRILPVLHRVGIPALAITYRNDEGCPPAPNGRYSYGHAEWEEVHAAAEWALRNGAKRLLLVGYSMGGATSVSFLEKSDLAHLVDGVILDAPMIDLETTVQHAARLVGVPLWFLSVSNRVSALRYGFKWRHFDHRDATRQISKPVLLFHGDNDRTVPVSTSDDFARFRPEVVEYHRFVGVDHVRAWNADPGRYEAAVDAFLRRHLGT